MVNKIIKDMSCDTMSIFDFSMWPSPQSASCCNSLTNSTSISLQLWKHTKYNGPLITCTKNESNSKSMQNHNHSGYILINEQFIQVHKIRPWLVYFKSFFSSCIICIHSHSIQLWQKSVMLNLTLQGNLSMISNNLFSNSKHLRLIIKEMHDFCKSTLFDL